MTNPDNIPTPFPVRHVNGLGWQVLIVPEDKWLDCFANEDDARAIANTPVLEYEALEKTRSGDDFAMELENVSTALARYRIGFGSRFFLRCAKIARNEI